jgi:hypothetical protein
MLTPNHFEKIAGTPGKGQLTAVQYAQKQSGIFPGRPGHPNSRYQ